MRVHSLGGRVGLRGRDERQQTRAVATLGLGSGKGVRKAERADVRAAGLFVRYVRGRNEPLFAMRHAITAEVAL